MTFSATPDGGLISPGQPESLRVGVCGLTSGHTREKTMTIAIKQQDEIAVFVNENNGVTIKQTNSLGEESVVYLWAEHAEALVHAIERVAVEAEEASRWEQIQEEKAVKRLADSGEVAP